MTKRIHAIDAVRGFCLLNIFVNHVTLGVVHEVSPSKILLFDSAEVFVLLAGISAWLAYGPRERGFEFASCGKRMWSRAAVIYLFALLTIAGGLAISVAGSLVAPPPDPTTTPVGLADRHGWPTYLLHLVTLQQSVGYSLVLRLYVFLMVLGPVYLWLASLRWYWPLIPAGAIWLTAGCLTIVSRDSLTGGWLSMSVLPWNLVFAAGVSLGAAISSKVAFPAASRLVPTCMAVALGGILLLSFGSHVPEIAAWLEVRNEHFWTGISKTLQSPLRLLHLAAVVGCVVALRDAPLIRLIHGAGPDGFLSRVGRRSLEVFVLGAVLAPLVDQILWGLAQTHGLVLRSASAIVIEIAAMALALAAMAFVAGARPARRAAGPREAAAVRAS
jgi:hypothetical protein